MLRSPSRRRSSRAGFTLLEVLLASAIGLLILGGVYLALNMQLRYAESGRAQVEQATLVRSLMARINADVAPSIGLADPSRYQQSTSGQSGSSGTSGGTGSASPSTTTTPATGASTAGASSSSSSSSSSTSATPSPGQDNPANPMRGVFGDESSLRVWVGRVPPVLSDPTIALDTNVVPVSDQRVVQYWLAGRGGLARQEVTVVTNTADQIPWASGSGDETKYIIAPEVTAVQFSYFDGLTWQTSWNSTDPGSDGMTPQGPPVAIAVLVEITLPGVHGGQPRVRQFRHVVAIPTANGQPQQNSGTTQSGQSGQGSGTSSNSQP